MFTIIGAGFGLYGYLPAIVNVTQHKVVLAKQYREMIESRAELVRFLDNIEWQPSLQAALARASCVVIATSPEAQSALVQEVLNIGNITRLIIEKPVCPDPGEAIKLVERVVAESKRFRVGYSFLYTNWYTDLKKRLPLPASRLRITWTFRADHFLRCKKTWKRYHSMGGGALRFYGIHVVATLASLGYEETIISKLAGASPDEPAVWSAQFVGENIPLCEICVSTDSNQNQFQIEILDSDGRAQEIYSEESPLATSKTPDGQDGRVPILEQLIHSFACKDDEYMKIYQSTNRLWARTESHHNE